MTYCELCRKEIRKDEWRKHIISEEHLEIEDKYYCDLCKTKTPMEKIRLSEYVRDRREHAKHVHLNPYSGIGGCANAKGPHQLNEERLQFYSS